MHTYAHTRVHARTCAHTHATTRAAGRLCDREPHSAGPGFRFSRDARGSRCLRLESPSCPEMVNGKVGAGRAQGTRLPRPVGEPRLTLHLPSPGLFFRLSQEQKDEIVEAETCVWGHSGRGPLGAGPPGVAGATGGRGETREQQSVLENTAGDRGT